MIRLRPGLLLKKPSKRRSCSADRFVARSNPCPCTGGRLTPTVFSRTPSTAPGATLDLTFTQSGNTVGLGESTTPPSTVKTTKYTNTYGTTNGVVIGTTFTFNLNMGLETSLQDSTNRLSHRYFQGTVNGSSLNGTYADESDTGTFTLTRQ